MRKPTLWIRPQTDCLQMQFFPEVKVPYSASVQLKIALANVKVVALWKDFMCFPNYPGFVYNCNSRHEGHALPATGKASMCALAGRPWCPAGLSHVHLNTASLEQLPSQMGHTECSVRSHTWLPGGWHAFRQLSRPDLNLFGAVKITWALCFTPIFFRLRLTRWCRAGLLASLPLWLRP